VARLRCTRNAEKFRPYAQDIPLFVDTRNPDKWCHRLAPLTQAAGGCDLKRDIRRHGPLGAVYSIPKEGDSASFVYLIPTGLSDPMARRRSPAIVGLYCAPTEPPTANLASEALDGRARLGAAPCHGRLRARPRAALECGGCVRPAAGAAGVTIGIVPPDNLAWPDLRWS
jgi:hypothetical protein